MSVPTLVDVARVAGVSRSTVSRVVNDDPSVSEETRARVRTAIDSLRYRPNLSARSLVSRQPAALGVLVGGVTGFGPQCDLNMIQSAARAAGRRVFTQVADDLSEHAISHALDALLELRVDAIISLVPQAALVDQSQLKDLGVPLVGVEVDADVLPLTVGVDNELGARLATTHLLDLGHAVVVHLAGPKGWNESESRIRGWRTALDARGLEAPSVFRASAWTAEAGYRAGQEIAGLGGVTAVFCANDHLALGLLSALRDRDLLVPGDVSVVGFDDVAEAAHFTPPLTTVRQDFHELARRAVATAEVALSGGAMESGMVAPRLVARRSTAPARG